MIQSYRDKRTKEFAEGKRVKEFESFRRQAEKRLDILDAATSLADLQALPSNALEGMKGDRKGHTASASICSGGSVSNGLKGRADPRTSKSWTTTERNLIMARTPIHPGETLADELEALGVSPTELSRQIRVPANRISQIINGKRSITGDTALRLAHWFGTSPQFWMNLQALYDVRIAEEDAGTEIKTLPTKPEKSPTGQPQPA